MLRIAKDWNCKPREVLDEPAFWVELQVLQYQAEYQGHEDREANREQAAEAQEQIRRSLGR